MINTLPRRLGMAAFALGFVLAGTAAVQAQSFDDLNPNGQPAYNRGHNANPGNNGPFSQPVKPQRRHYRSVAHYVLGTWQIRLRNGEVLQFTFKRDGKFTMVNRTRGFVAYGHWRTKGMAIQIVGVGRCDRANGCTRMKSKLYTIRIRPVSAGRLVTPSGTWRRIA